MRVVDPTLDYYAITLSVGSDEEIIVETQTFWTGFQDVERSIETRVASKVKPELFVRYWEMILEPYLVVNTEEEWLTYYFRGGHALVAEQVAKSFLPTTLVPDPCLRINDDCFTSLTLIPPAAHRRAPSPKLRMRVMNRDSRKCQICGRSPVNHVDVELHVHHIRPWGEGGITLAENLITLCHTCHRGLEPHYDGSLYKHIPRSQENLDYAKNIERYREVVFRHLIDAKPQRRKSKKKNPSRRMGRH